MCCFTAKTEVHSTTIFARLSRPDTQALAYQMQFSSTEPTAMILPLPVALPAKEDSVVWRDLKGYPELFADLNRGFPPKPELQMPFARSKSAAAPAEDMLAVHEVGDFVASFVPSINDFARLDPRFVIKKEVWSQIPEYRDYGFAVFQLKSLSGSPHPIAFEWKTRLRDQVFFPTVHIHDGSVHAEDDFDHALYIQSSDFDAKVSDYDGPDSIDRRTGFVRSSAKVAEFASSTSERSLGLVNPDQLVHKRTLLGRHPNRDTIVSTSALATPAGCGRCDVSVAGGSESSRAGAGAALLTALAWMVRRRNVVRGQ